MSLIESEYAQSESISRSHHEVIQLHLSTTFPFKTSASDLTKMSFHMNQSIHINNPSPSPSPPISIRRLSPTSTTTHSAEIDYKQKKIELLEAELRLLKRKDRRLSTDYRLREAKLGQVEAQNRMFREENRRLRRERDEYKRMVVKEGGKGGKGVVYVSKREKEEKWWLWD